MLENQLWGRIAFLCLVLAFIISFRTFEEADVLLVFFFSFYLCCQNTGSVLLKHQCY